MSEYNLKTGGGLKKKIFTLLALLALVAGYFAYQGGYIKGTRPTNAVETAKLDEMQGKFTKDATADYDVAKDPLPSGTESDEKVFAKVNIYDWHGNTALVYANGGEITLANSAIGKEGIAIKIAHQDDNGPTFKEFMTRAKDFKESGGTTGGNFMFTIMGNASVPLLEPLNKELHETVDPDYSIVGIDVVGKSDGEDQFIGPAEWKTNPELMRGAMVVGVYDDGDIQGPAVMFADKVGIPVNFDYHTWNKNALNIENVSSFTEAGKIFLAGGPLAPRPEVDDAGRKTGKTTQDLGIVLKKDALASWTPVDRNIVRDMAKSDPARFKSLATLSSTGYGSEYKIMPTTLICLKQWADKNVDKLTKLSYAVHKAAIQIGKYPDALQKAMELNTSIMGIWDDGGSAAEAATQRLMAFKGYDAPGNKKLHVGGSSAFTFKDAVGMVGISDRGDDIANSTFASVYRSFGNLTIKKYPEKHLKAYRPFEEFFDARFLRAAYSRAKQEGIAAPGIMVEKDYTQEAPSEAIGSTNFNITFKSGSAEIQKYAYEVLRQIQDDYAGSQYAIKIVGHTDRTGSDEVNIPLSQRRADAVKQYLVAKNPSAFGGNRITTDGKGSTEPAKGVDPDYSGDNAKCRRVEIIIYGSGN